MNTLRRCIVAVIAAGLSSSIHAAGELPALPTQSASTRVLPDMQLAVSFDVGRSQRVCGFDPPCVAIKIANQGDEPVTIRHAAQPADNVDVLLYAQNGKLVTPWQGSVF